MEGFKGEWLFSWRVYGCILVTELCLRLAEAAELDLHQGPPTRVPLPTHVPQEPSQLAAAAAAIMMGAN